MQRHATTPPRYHDCMIPFLKMHGLGNDFVVMDNRNEAPFRLDWRKVADRHFGIGCDQVVLLEPSDKADIRMRIFNADGGEVNSCGNASRCIAWLMRREKPGLRRQKSVSIETGAGVIDAWVDDAGLATIDMGEPKFDWKDIPLKQKADTSKLDIQKGPLEHPVALSMGNPHAVFFVRDVDAVGLDVLGPELENHPMFPERANIGVAHVESKTVIRLRVWERGAGLTLACGTGACAALVAASSRGLTDRKADVKLPGGSLQIEWREEDGHVLMTGPAAIVYEGLLNPDHFRI